MKAYRRVQQPEWPDLFTSDTALDILEQVDDAIRSGRLKDAQIGRRLFTAARQRAITPAESRHLDAEARIARTLINQHRETTRFDELDADAVPAQETWTPGGIVDRIPRQVVEGYDHMERQLNNSDRG